MDKSSGKLVRSCAIITTSPNELMEPIHDRMPVILSLNAEEPWLAPSIDHPDRLKPLPAPYPAEEMEAYTVSTLVNLPRNDHAACIKPNL